jgi:hypothetical protein
LLKFAAQMASNWALFKDGSVAICSESLSCTHSPLRPKFRPVWTVTLCSGTQSSQIKVGKHRLTYSYLSVLDECIGDHMQTDVEGLLKPSSTTFRDNRGSEVQTVVFIPLSKLL